jgi:hypothetical protein
MESLAPFVVLALCATPWLLLVSLRHGVVLAGVIVFAGVPLLVLVLYFLSPLIGASPSLLLMVTSAALGVLGAILLVPRRSSLRKPSTATVALVLPATLGGLAWFATLVLARLSGADALSWAMNGDSANNIHLARTVLGDNGIVVPLKNLVLQPTAMLSLAMSFGRPDDALGAELLHRDLEALSIFWGLAIAATAALLGIVAASLLTRGRPAVIAVASGAGSLLVVTWFVSGLPIESGYLNVHFALPLALASWLAFLHSGRAPWLSAAALLALGLLLLATWAPLVVLTISLTIALGVRNRRRLRLARWQVLAAAAGVAACAAVGGWLLVLPILQQSAGTLGVPGHGYPFTGWLLVFCALVTGGCAVGIPRDASTPLHAGVIATVLAAVVSVGIFTSLVPGDQPWIGYYPTKLTYLLTVVLLAIALSTLVRRLAVGRLALLKATSIGAAVLLLCTLGPSPARVDFRIDQPLDRILAAKVWTNGDESVKTILAGTGLDHAVVLWGTSSPDEAMINFWLFEFNGGEDGGDPYVRKISVAAYRIFRDSGTYTAPSVGVLCKVVEGLGRQVVVITANPGLKSEVAETCPDAPVSVTRE